MSPGRRGRRRPDPLAVIFEEEIVPLLEPNPGLRAVALYEEMMRLSSGDAPRGQAHARAAGAGLEGEARAGA